MISLRKKFKHRDELIDYVARLCPWAKDNASPILGGLSNANARLSQLCLTDYGRTRSFSHGTVTKLSAYISHGILSLNKVRTVALDAVSNSLEITRFIQELAWRDFWARVLKKHSEWSWNNVETYKTGFSDEDYDENLPYDIEIGYTNVACIDNFIKQLLDTGYIHNHIRMYLASYIVHFRRVKWQTGAKWFLQHLIDADEASNNFSWQWIASTFSDKPYIFNLENVKKYFGEVVDTDPLNNAILDKSYEQLRLDLFPKNQYDK